MFYAHAPNPCQFLGDFTTLAIAGIPSSTGSRRRPFELDDITFRILAINGRSLAFGTVARFRRARGNPLRLEFPANACRVERFHPEANMIQVAAFRARRSAAGTPQLAIDRHKINQGPAGPKLDQPYRILSPLDRATEHVAIEMKHRVYIDDTQHQVINFANADHDLSSCRHIPLYPGPLAPSPPGAPFMMG
jgi:hypothetical protein